MASVSTQVEWHGAEYEARLRRADRAGLLAMVMVFLGRVAVNLNRPGTPTAPTAFKSLIRGFARLGKTLGISDKFLQRGTLTEGTTRRLTGRSAAARREERDALQYALMPHMRGNIFVDPPGGMPRRRTGTLLGSLTHEEEADSVIAGAATKYAAIHEFGGMAGRGRKVYIPARPYLRPSLNRAKEEMFEAYLAQVRGVIGGTE